jgi:hypothetical protein
VIARRENAAASLVKTRDALAVGARQPVSRIDCEKPELVDISCVEHAQDNVVPFRVDFAIARCDLVDGRLVVVLYRSQMIA